MSVLKRIFLVTIFIICISFSLCYAIDENQLSTNSSTISTTPSTSGNSTIDDAMSINTEQNEINSGNTNSGMSITSTTTSTSAPTSTSASTSTSTSDSQTSTRVSSISNNSNKSTISDILNIALIVVGVLLIFLAIAILIRLNS